MGKVYRLYPEMRETAEVPAWGVRRLGPQVGSGSCQKCVKQLERKNQWAPPLLRGLVAYC